MPFAPTQPSVRDQSCPRRTCPRFAQKLSGNVVVHARAYPRYKCVTCAATWVAHKDAVHYGLRTDVEKIAQALELFAAGASVRHIAKMLIVSPSSVQRWRSRWIAERRKSLSATYISY